MRKLSEPAVPLFAIRKMTSADVPAVMEVEKHAFKNPWSEELIRRELTHDWSTTLLAEEPGPPGALRLLGLSIFWLVHDELHLLNVAVHPDDRRRGVARALIEATLGRGRSHRCTLATLEVRRGNEAALALYQGFGFRPVGVRPNYYVDEGEDAIVMVLDL